MNKEKETKSIRCSTQNDLACFDSSIKRNPRLYKPKEKKKKKNTVTLTHIIRNLFSSK